MTTRSWCTSDDCERDTNGESPADLEEGSKDINTNHSGDWVGRGESKRSDRGDAWKDVEEHSGCFGHHLTENPWSLVLEIELPLGDWLGRNNMSSNMALENL